MLHILGVTVENIPLFVCYELCSFHIPQEEPLDIFAHVVWRLLKIIYIIKSGIIIDLGIPPL